MSTFKSDLNKEQLLSIYLDSIYKSKNIPFKRINDYNLQMKGIDVTFHINSKDYLTDEKAQLHYLNHDLPTFTFELSYLNKDNNVHEGWLFDEKKETDYYFLITGIFLKNSQKTFSTAEDIEKLKITSVNRNKLIHHLESIDLSKSKLMTYDFDLRSNKTFGKNSIPEFKNQKNGCLYFTTHLSEKPINLQLNLEYLIENKIAKRFH